jgi:hypothetical protein
MDSPGKSGRGKPAEEVAASIHVIPQIKRSGGREMIGRESFESVFAI